MTALRIMTFNVQCLPLVATAIQGQSEVAEGRAKVIANALLSLPVRDRPDVVAFNEVFNEDARDAFVKKLKAAWPHVVSKVHDGGVKDDAGLMLFSRYPFKVLPSGDTRVEVFYQDSAGSDSLAQKAVCVIQISEPYDPTTIAFTHLQASYDTEDQHSEVRARQFDDVETAIMKALSGQIGPTGQTIVLGDLNVRGDPEAVSGEWGNLFEPPQGAFFTKFLDGWRTYMRPPNAPGRDLGHTNMDVSKNDLRQRLDYICFVRPETVDIALKPQHMRVRLRGLSDHFALEAVVQRASDYCTPSEARDFLADVPVNSGGGIGKPSTVRQTPVAFSYDGSWQWFYVREPGTYSFFSSPNVILECYHETDLSVPIERLDEINLADLSPELRDGLGESFDPRGDTFVTREPFFVAVRDRTSKSGSGFVGMVEHHGESKATAIGLLPEVTVVSSFPLGQKLGNDDLCWFKSLMPATLTQSARTETFEVENPTGIGITVEVQDSVNQLSKVSGAQPKLEATTSAIGEELLFLVIARDSDTVNGYRVTWHCPVGYLDLDQPIYLFVNDETGVDWPGADEPELSIKIDSEWVFEDAWDDADTGELWPGLHEAIKARCAALSPGKRRIGFAEEIYVTAFDPDFNAQGVFPSVSIKPLRPDDPPVKKRVESLTIPDVISDGLYTFGCTLSRFP